MICHRNARLTFGIFILAGFTVSIVAGVAPIAVPPGPAARTVIPRGDRADKEERGQSLSDRLQPLPASYRVQEQYDDRYAGRVRKTRDEEQVIYSNTNGQFLYRSGRGFRVADDLFAPLVGPCTVNTLRLRVTGGVEGGGGVFLADVSLYDGCPAFGEGGTEIPGTLVRFRDLDDDLTLFHHLVLDYSDRGICDDGTKCRVSLQNCVDAAACQPDPIQIPPEVWVRFRFDTEEAAVVAGSPATIGFSFDGFDHALGSCTTWFRGWPTFPHASFWVELTAPSECEIEFLAYSAADPDEFAFLPTQLPPPLVGEPTTRLGDDIRLSVDDCILSAFEIGMKGTVGPYEMSIDLRWPSLLDVIPETVRTFSGRGGGSVEVARFTIPPEIELRIDRLDQPIYITWAADRSNTGVLEVNVTQTGESGPEFFAFDTDPKNPDTWTTLFEPNGSPAVFYAAVYCRGEAPLGACCVRSDVGRVDMCVDDVPETYCQQQDWVAGGACSDNPFDPRCGMYACCLPDESCEDLLREECLATCDADPTPLPCEFDDDCPGERTCGTPSDADLCTPPCGRWENAQHCENFDCPEPCDTRDFVGRVYFADAEGIGFGSPTNCAIDARQPHDPNRGQDYGWDRIVFPSSFCVRAALPWSVFDFRVTRGSDPSAEYPESIVFDAAGRQMTVFFENPMRPGEWTCIEHIDTGQKWCAGFLPGDVNQSRVVTASDILPLIDFINGHPFSNNQFETDINRGGHTQRADIRRLIELLNGEGEFETWIARSLPPCPSEE